MVDVTLVVSIVSIAFLVGVVGVVSYFAFAGPSRDLTATGEGDRSTAD
jgi:hypothetical protein